MLSINIYEEYEFLKTINANHSFQERLNEREMVVWGLTIKFRINNLLS